MASASSALLFRLQSRMGDGWAVRHDPYGFAHADRSSEAALCTVSVWSLEDREPDWPAQGDTLQIELIATVRWLEDYLAAAFGKTFANERGKTSGIFLHRLIPDGRSFGSGFPVQDGARSDALSLDQVCDRIERFGLPFLARVESEEALTGPDPMCPRFVDPVNWTVRRALCAMAEGADPAPTALLEALSGSVRRGLEDKFGAIAAVSSLIDVEERVEAGLDRYRQVIDYFARRGQSAVLELRRCRASKGLHRA